MFILKKKKKEDFTVKDFEQFPTETCFRDQQSVSVSSRQGGPEWAETGTHLGHAGWFTSGE